MDKKLNIGRFLRVEARDGRRVDQPLSLLWLPTNAGSGPELAVPTGSSVLPWRLPDSPARSIFTFVAPLDQYEPWLWSPSPSIRAPLPDESRALLFGCDRQPDGTRVFLPMKYGPVDVSAGFIFGAFFLGLRMIELLPDLYPEGSSESSRFLWHVFTRVRSTRAFQSRQFRGPNDLNLRRGSMSDGERPDESPGRFGFGEYTVVPHQFGDWTLRAIEAAGRKAAEKLGLRDPSFATVRAFGLIEIAREAANHHRQHPPATRFRKCLFAEELSDETLAAARSHPIVRELTLQRYLFS